MKPQVTSEFRTYLGGLPVKIRDQARAAYARFRQNPWHPGIHFKKGNDDLNIYSARVGRQYRAVGIVEGDKIIWFWIGPHGEYDKLLDRI